MDQPTAVFTILVMVVTAWFTYRGLQSPRFEDAYLLDTERVLRDKQYRRVLTSGLLHADWPHFLFNMFSLYSFGKYVELVYGAPTFLLIYVTSIVGGGALAVYLHRHHSYRALGASGGVCGVILASIFLLPGGSVRLFLMPIPIPAWAYAILFILYSFFGMRTGRDNIGHDAHLGGALVGLGVAALLHPRIITASPVLFVTVVLLSAGLLVYTFRFPPSLYPSSPFSAAHWRRILADLQAERRTRHQGQARQSDQEQLDALLEKISRDGMDGLSEKEKDELRDISRRIKQKRSEG